MRGAGSTIDSVMPVSTVIIGGIGTPGFTSVSKRPSSSPPRSFSAPISVIASVFGRAARGLEVEHDERDLRQRACRDRRATAGAGRRTRRSCGSKPGSTAVSGEVGATEREA